MNIIGTLNFHKIVSVLKYESVPEYIFFALYVITGSTILHKRLLFWHICNEGVITVGVRYNHWRKVKSKCWNVPPGPAQSGHDRRQTGDCQSLQNCCGRLYKRFSKTCSSFPVYYSLLNGVAVLFCKGFVHHCTTSHLPPFHFPCTSFVLYKRHNGLLKWLYKYLLKL